VDQMDCADIMLKAVERKRSRSIARRESFSGTEEDLQKFRDAVAANEKEKAVELERDIEEYALKVRELRGGRAVSPPSPARDRRAAGRPARPGRVESPSPPRRRVTTQLENLSSEKCASGGGPDLQDNLDRNWDTSGNAELAGQETANSDNTAEADKNGDDAINVESGTVEADNKPANQQCEDDSFKAENENASNHDISIKEEENSDNEEDTIRKRVEAAKRMAEESARIYEMEQEELREKAKKEEVEKQAAEAISKEEEKKVIEKETKKKAEEELRVKAKKEDAEKQAAKAIAKEEERKVIEEEVKKKAEEEEAAKKAAEFEAAKKAEEEKAIEEEAARKVAEQTAIEEAAAEKARKEEAAREEEALRKEADLQATEEKVAKHVKEEENTKSAEEEKRQQKEDAAEMKRDQEEKCNKEELACTESEKIAEEESQEEEKIQEKEEKSIQIAEEEKSNQTKQKSENLENMINSKTDEKDGPPIKEDTELENVGIEDQIKINGWNTSNSANEKQSDQVEIAIPITEVDDAEFSETAAILPDAEEGGNFLSIVDRIKNDITTLKTLSKTGNQTSANLSTPGQAEEGERRRHKTADPSIDLRESEPEQERQKPLENSGTDQDGNRNTAGIKVALDRVAREKSAGEVAVPRELSSHLLSLSSANISDQLRQSCSNIVARTMDTESSKEYLLKRLEELLKAERRQVREDLRRRAEQLKETRAAAALELAGLDTKHRAELERLRGDQAARLARLQADYLDQADTLRAELELLECEQGRTCTTVLPSPSSAKLSEIERDLQCCSCQQVCRPPVKIYQCEEWDLLCEVCTARLNTTHLCRNKGMEKIAAKYYQ